MKNVFAYILLTFLICIVLFYSFSIRKLKDSYFVRVSPLIKLNNSTNLDFLVNSEPIVKESELTEDSRILKSKLRIRRKRSSDRRKRRRKNNETALTYGNTTSSSLRIDDLLPVEFEPERELFMKDDSFFTKIIDMIKKKKCKCDESGEGSTVIFTTEIITFTEVKFTQVTFTELTEVVTFSAVYRTEPPLFTETMVTGRYLEPVTENPRIRKAGHRRTNTSLRRVETRRLHRSPMFNLNLKSGRKRKRKKKQRSKSRQRKKKKSSRKGRRKSRQHLEDHSIRSHMTDSYMRPLAHRFGKPVVHPVESLVGMRPLKKQQQRKPAQIASSGSRGGSRRKSRRRRPRRGRLGMEQKDVNTQPVLINRTAFSFLQSNTSSVSSSIFTPFQSSLISFLKHIFVI